MSEAKERSEVGARLKQAREYCGYSQEEVANAIGVSRSSISLMESGSRGVDILELKKLAVLYQSSVEDLTGATSAAPDAKDIQMVARAAQGLSSADIEEVLRFAQFLKKRKRGGGPAGQKK